MSLLVPPRVPSDEILDGDVPPDVAVASLADIEWIHRALGGRSIVRRHLVPLLLSVPSPRPVLLDLGAGSGHVGRSLTGELSRRGRELVTIDLDRQLLHARLSARSRSIAADALRLPFTDRSVDVVSSTLFLHHFDAASVAALLCESARVARFAVVALDLTRHRVPLAINALLSRLAYRSPITRLDGRASVLQAWTVPELRAIAARALPGTLVKPAGPFVQGLLWKRT
ncbi:MAG TPA: methyltransferase domain-containing protein [Thermoanaerobaculia bacterium]|nr:methyltransferase domain-containing protein [Thermoanaerobaculia bacterium]